MTSVLSTVMIAAPPAFLAGWVLSKVLFRHLARAQPVVTSVGDLTVPAPSATVLESASSAATGDIARQVLQTLREKLVAAEARLQPLRAEVQLLKEAAAEREQQIAGLRQQLQLQAMPPEEVVGGETLSATARQKQLLGALHEKSKAQAERIALQNKELTEVRNRLQRAARRAVKRRARVQPLRRQLRQQRAVLSELREELRQRDLRQQEQEAVRSRQQIAAKADPSPATDALSANNVSQENLQALHGVGPALHKKLNEQGIYRLKQLALMSTEELHTLCKALGLSQKVIERTRWSRQARLLLNMPEPAADSLLTAN